MSIQIGFIWLLMRSIGGLWWKQYWICGVCERYETYWPTDRLLATIDGLCPTESIAVELDNSLIIIYTEIYNDGKGWKLLFTVFLYADVLPRRRWLPEKREQETSSLSMCENRRSAPGKRVRAIQFRELIFYTRSYDRNTRRHWSTLDIVCA